MRGCVLAGALLPRRKGEGTAVPCRSGTEGTLWGLSLPQMVLQAPSLNIIFVRPLPANGHAREWTKQEEEAWTPGLYPSHESVACVECSTPGSRNPAQDGGMHPQS